MGFGGPAWIRTRNQQITSQQLKTNDFSDFPLAFVVTSKQIWAQLLPQMLPKLPASTVNCSVHRRPAAALLVFLPRAARAEFVSTSFRHDEMINLGQGES